MTNQHAIRDGTVVEDKTEAMCSPMTATVHELSVSLRAAESCPFPAFPELGNMVRDGSIGDVNSVPKRLCRTLVHRDLHETIGATTGHGSGNVAGKPLGGTPRLERGEPWESGPQAGRRQRRFSSISRSSYVRIARS
jgi:hypothetical protein